jgi:hypothetical protein
MKEYHIHKSPLPDGAEQVIITSLVRNEEEERVTVKEIFVVTRIGDKEVKSRIDVEALMHNVVRNPGGNVPVKNYDKMYELLDQVTPEQEQLQNQIDLYQHEFQTDISKDLIFGAEMAAACHTTNFENIIEELLNENPSCK